MLLTGMSNNIQAKKIDEVEDSQGKAENNQPPSELNNIQPRSMQVCNCH